MLSESWHGVECPPILGPPAGSCYLAICRPTEKEGMTHLVPQPSLWPFCCEYECPDIPWHGKGEHFHRTVSACYNLARALGWAEEWVSRCHILGPPAGSCCLAICRPIEKEGTIELVPQPSLWHFCCEYECSDIPWHGKGEHPHRTISAFYSLARALG